MRIEQCWASRKEGNVTEMVGQMTREELKGMIDAAVEQKLIEILGDPDEELEIRDAVRDRLLRQRQAVATGEQGLPFDDVVRQLGLE
jgi:hypothetical protein